MPHHSSELTSASGTSWNPVMFCTTCHIPYPGYNRRAGHCRPSDKRISQDLSRHSSPKPGLPTFTCQHLPGSCLAWSVMVSAVSQLVYDKILWCDSTGYTTEPRNVPTASQGSRLASVAVSGSHHRDVECVRQHLSVRLLCDRQFCFLHFHIRTTAGLFVFVCFKDNILLQSPG